MAQVGMVGCAVVCVKGFSCSSWCHAQQLNCTELFMVVKPSQDGMPTTFTV